MTMRRRTAVKGIAASAVSLAIGGCSPSGESHESAQPPTADLAEAKAAAPSGPSGRLAIGLSSLGTAEIWLPWMEAGREGWLVLEPIYESLVAADPATGEFQPQLAEKYEVSPDGKTWTFTLRQGIQFHGGNGELTSDDVAFSYAKYISEKALASNRPILISLVQQLEIVSPYELVFHLKVPDVTFLGRLANGQFGVASRKYVEKVGEKEAAEKPMGTGPFRMVEHKRQELVRLEALDSHWRQTPSFAKLLLRRVPDQSARLAMLRSGEVDVSDVPYKFKGEAQAAGLKFFRGEGAAIYHVQLGGQMLPTRATFDPTVPWVGDPKDPAAQERAHKVRMAMNLAVNRQEIVDSIFDGEGQLSVAPYFAPGSKFVDPSLKPHPYDPAQAKQLLAEAGYEQGFPQEIQMLVMPFPGRDEMADVDEAVAGYWEKNLGLKVKRLPMDFGTYAHNVGGPHKTAWVTWAHGYTPRPVAEPIAGMETWLTSKARYNSAVEAPRIDELAAAIRADVDPKTRVEDYRAMSREFHEHAYAVPIASIPSLYAYNPKVLKSWPMQPGEAYLSGYERAVRA